MQYAHIIFMSINRHMRTVLKTIPASLSLKCNIDAALMSQDIPTIDYDLSRNHDT